MWGSRKPLRVGELLLSSNPNEMAQEILGTQYTYLPYIPVSIVSYGLYAARGWFGMRVYPSLFRMSTKDQSNLWSTRHSSLHFSKNTSIMKRQWVELLRGMLLEMHRYLWKFSDVFRADSKIGARHLYLRSYWGIWGNKEKWSSMTSQVSFTSSCIPRNTNSS